jgi:DNA (cytosine-5)-methyltransferase 1
MPDTSEELRRLRMQAGLSQAQLASKVGYGLKTIKRWELGAQAPRQAVIEYLRASHATVHHSPADDFTFIDLFAGIGGMRLGFEAAGGRCVFTSEWDKYSQRTYRANFGDEEIAGDIREVPIASIPDHDVLLAGFPCQPFSLAGVSKKNSLGRPHGFDCTTQGTLFFEIEKILRAKKPAAFVLENVKNLQSHDGGKTFATIMRVLRDELGYSVSHRVVDARAYVPQHRERIFIVGFKRECGFDLSRFTPPPAETWPRLESILHPLAGDPEPEEPYTDARGRVAAKYVLTDHLWRYLRDYAEKHRAMGNGFGFSRVGPKDIARTLSARYHKDGSEILISRGSGNPRRLTPRECARLMGFDSGERRWRIPVSDTQAYRQFGNAVVPAIVETIAREMKPFITQRKKPLRAKATAAVA